MPVVPFNFSQINGALRNPGASLEADQFTFSVPGGASIWPGYAVGSEPDVGYATFTNSQGALFRSAVQAWDELIAPNFAEVADDANGRGEVRAAFTTVTLAGATAYAYSGTPQPPGGQSGDIWIDQQKVENNLNQGTFGYTTLLHELGHVLGLKHPFEGTTLPDTSYDELEYTVMSYTDNVLLMTVWFDAASRQYGFSTGEAVEPLTPMVLDIAAVQSIYGADPTTRAGNTIYTPTPNEIGFRTIYDAGGVDTIDLSAFTDPNRIDLRPGSYSDVGTHSYSPVSQPQPDPNLSAAEYQARLNAWLAFQHWIQATYLPYLSANDITAWNWTNNLAIAFGTVIENAVGGSANDSLNGNEVANVLDGRAGDDTIIGNGGDDTLTGGAGLDTLSGGAGKDAFSDTAAGLNGDTIADLESGEKIVLADATLTGFSYSLTNHLLAFTGGLLTLTTVPAGNLTAAAAPGGGVEMTFLSSQFGSAALAVTGFGAAPSAGGWSSDEVFPRVVADVNGDGHADVAGFGSAGIYVALGTDAGTFAPSFLALSAFGSSVQAGGWASSDRYPRELADVNGDGRADVVGFGEAGIYTALARSDGSFAPSLLALGAFGAGASAGGWASDDKYPRMFADVNGDGRADIVGFGEAGVYVALAKSDGTFAPSFLSLNSFGAGASGGSWTTDGLYPRQLADVNGDGMADIVGFGSAGVYVALSTGAGHFTSPTLTFGSFGSSAGAGGWTSQDIFPRELGDVNGDHKADIVGFGAAGTYVSYGNGDGTFEPAFLGLSGFGSAAAGGGWASQDSYPRYVADVNHDGFADVLGFGNAGVYVALSAGDIWA